MFCMINIAIAILCFLFSLSSIFNIISFIGLETYIMTSDIVLVICWMLSCLIAGIIAIRLYHLIRYHQKNLEG